MASSTMARLVAVHFWPVEKKAAFTTFSTAEGKSASASTMVGFLPPISSWIRRCRRLDTEVPPAGMGVQPGADFAGASEGDGLERGGIDQGAAQFAAGAGHEVDHTDRK